LIKPSAFGFAELAGVYQTAVLVTLDIALTVAFNSC